MEEEGRKKDCMENSVCDLFHFWPFLTNYTQTSKTWM